MLFSLGIALINATHRGRQSSDPRAVQSGCLVARDSPVHIGDRSQAATVKQQIALFESVDEAKRYGGAGFAKEILGDFSNVVIGAFRADEAFHAPVSSRLALRARRGDSAKLAEKRLRGLGRV